MVIEPEIFVRKLNQFVFRCILSFPYLEKVIKVLQRARLGDASRLSATPSWGFPLSAFPNGATSKLAGLFSTLSL